jgi:hypothetical protein
VEEDMTNKNGDDFPTKVLVRHMDAEEVSFHRSQLRAVEESWNSLVRQVLELGKTRDDFLSLLRAHKHKLSHPTPHEALMQLIATGNVYFAVDLKQRPDGGYDWTVTSMVKKEEK